MSRGTRGFRHAFATRLCGKIPLKHISDMLGHNILDRYAAEIRGLGLVTRRGLLLNVRAFARWLALLAPGSSAEVGVPVHKPAPDRHHLYSRQEAAAIIRGARRLDASRWPLRPACHATLIGLLYATGLRVGEAPALNVGDIDPAAGRLTVRKGKMGKARNVALSGSTTAALHLTQAGNDITLVKAWLGHADIKTTSMYVEINIEMKRKALDAFPPPARPGGTPREKSNWRKPEVMKFLHGLSLNPALC